MGNRRQTLTRGIIAVAALILIGGLFFWTQWRGQVIFFDGPDYVQAYSLVADTVSQSATIIINIPSGEDEAATERITFTPDIQGQWIPSDKQDEKLFKPDQKLELKKYYTVTMQTASGAIGKDFLVEEDPTILAIFPKNDSEADEQSNITIIFNRPMVPITTLDELLEATIPVEIKPATAGRFKWIGTRTLQFIPETTLIPSTHYTVMVKPGFFSTDGLPVASLEHTFITRPVRYENIQSGELIYNQPINVKFNQPVDLERMLPGITVENTNERKNIDFIAEYGTRRIYNRESEQEEDVVDQSLVLIYSKSDRFNRPRLWDFNESYYLNIQNVYPFEGDISINDDTGRHLNVTGIVKSVSALSDRTTFAEPRFFDPQGELVINFYEPIDVRHSKISADGLTAIRYGERCKQTAEAEAVFGTGCEKEPDFQQLILRFDPAALPFGKNVTVRLEAVRNTDQVQINRDPVDLSFTVVPHLAILKTTPSEGANSSSLTEFTICSNSPLLEPAQEDIDNVFTVNPLYDFFSWGKSYRVRSASSACDYDQFQTQIRYGLMPENEYSVSMVLTDHFDQTAAITRSFTTSPMQSKDLNFYHLQTNYNVTKPDQLTLTFATVNMEYVNMHICELSAASMLQMLEDPPEYWTSPDGISDCQKTWTETIDLPNRYWIRNHFQVNVSDYTGTRTGHFLISFSHPEYVEQTGAHRPIFERTYVTSTNLNVVEKRVEVHNNANADYQLSPENRDDTSNLYWVTNMETLEPVSGALIQLYGAPAAYGDARIALNETISTGSDGIALATPINNLRGAVISKGLDSALISSATSKLQYATTALDAKKLYLYTDKPIYRPGQSVQIKGLYRTGYDGEYDFAVGVAVPIQVFNSENKEILNTQLTLSDFGTVNDTLTLDSQTPLGRYRIASKNSYAYFDVEEYVSSPFKVEVSTDKEEYIAGDTLTLNVDADYFFGVPLEGGVVEYAVATQRYHFDKFSDDYFKFGSSWYHCYADCLFDDSFVLRNKQSLGPDGTTRIEQTLDFKELFDNEEDRLSKIFVLYVTVKNANGESVSAQKSVIVHGGEFYLGVKADRYFVAKNQTVGLRAKSVDVEGREVAVDGIDLTVSKVNWNYFKRREVDGAYYYRYEKQLAQIEQRHINTDSSGNWSGDISFKDDGQYEISVQAADKRGNVVRDTYSIYVYGAGRSSVQPRNDTSLDVITNASTVSVGDTAQIVIQSPFEKAKALITIERGKIFDFEIVNVNQSIYQHAFDIRKEYIPNIVASVTLISTGPDIKHGQLEFHVNTSEEELNIAVSSNKDQFLPGENVDLAFNVSDFAGDPAVAELSVAVVDLSVLALKGNPKKNPLSFFYAGFPHTISTISNLKNILHEVDVANETKGGGGAEPEDLAARKRGVFKETALWQAVLRTNDQGQANISFTLPDNLTSWQIEAVGITKDTKVGTGYEEFVSRKDLMLKPIQPRFVVPGDTFSIGAQVFNQTIERQSVDVSLASNTLLRDDQQDSQHVTLEPGASQTVYFTVQAPPVTSHRAHDYTLLAANDRFRDEVEKTIPVTPNNTYEAVATAGYSSGDSVNEYLLVPDNVVPDRGGLTINSSATLAVFLSDALNGLLSYPYGNTEQVASKLDAIALVKRGLNLENISDAFELKDVVFDATSYSVDQLVEIGLTRLYATQSKDGSFSYRPNGYPSLYLTAAVANTLLDLREAGYAINENSLAKARDALMNAYFSPQYVRNDDFAVTAAYTVYRISGGDVPEAFNSRIESIMADEQLINENLSSMSLAYLAMLVNNNQNVFGRGNKNKIYAILQNRIEIDSRGAFMPTLDTNVIWQSYETRVSDTAAALKALIAGNENNQIIDRLSRWLIRSRAKDGTWGSTRNTLHSIDAFTDYLVWREENESEFTLTTSLNGTAVQSFEYGPQTILTQNVLSVPMSQLPLNTLNIINFSKENRVNRTQNFYYDIALKYFLPMTQTPPRDEGFAIQRTFYRLEDEEMKTPITEAQPGDIVRGVLRIISPSSRNFVAVEDFIPAGLELINFNLTTSDQTLKPKSKFSWDYWNPRATGARLLSPDSIETLDDRLYLYKDHLAEGEYTYEYFARAAAPGSFNHLPAVVSELYFPEHFGRTSGNVFVVRR